MDALLAQYEPQVRDAFLAAVQAQKQSIDMAALIEALERRDVERAVQLLRANQQMMFPLTEALRGSVIAGGQAVAATLPLVIRGQFGFGGNPRAVAAVDQITGKLAEVLDAEATDMARAIIRDGIANGVPPRTQALDMVGRTVKGSPVRQGGFIGLDAPRADQARKVRAMLSDPDEIRRYFIKDRVTGKMKPRYTTTDRRFDKRVMDAIKSGKALDAKTINDIGERHTARLLRNRAETIAHDNTLGALNAGQHEGFGALMDSGLVDGMTVTWRSAADGKVRDSHKHLNGEERPFGELFPSIEGEGMAYPKDQSHGAGAEDTISCRCVAIYRTKKPEF